MQGWINYGKDLYVCFNNTIGSAFDDAINLKAMAEENNLWWFFIELNNPMFIGAFTSGSKLINQPTYTLAGYLLLITILVALQSNNSYIKTPLFAG